MNGKERSLKWNKRKKFKLIGIKQKKKEKEVQIMKRGKNTKERNTIQKLYERKKNRQTKFLFK